MSYIAFIDVLGVRSSAMISNNEYLRMINKFNDALINVSKYFDCRIYAYSDNAYIEIKNLSNMIKLFKKLREILMADHMYFVGAVDVGALSDQQINYSNERVNSMKFISTGAVDIFKTQSNFSGIGILLSNKVIEDMNKENLKSCYTPSIYKKRENNNETQCYLSMYDLSYDPVGLRKITNVVSDYLISVATNESAGKYYITPIISMIKNLDKNIIINDLKKLIMILCFKKIPEEFKKLSNNSYYSKLFIYALIDYVLSLNTDSDIYTLIEINGVNFETSQKCKEIIELCEISREELINDLPNIPLSVISYAHKNDFIKVLFNMN